MTIEPSICGYCLAQVKVIECGTARKYGCLNCGREVIEICPPVKGAKMERWNNKKRSKTENAKIDDFLEEVIAVSKKHGLSISHEDGHGAFEIEEFSESNEQWLRHAHDAT